MTLDERFGQAEALVKTGQSLEAQGSAEFLNAAVRHYDQALALLRSISPNDERVRHGVAITSMNRANALHKQQTPPSLDAAVSAYDDAIESLRTLPIDQFPDLRNSLGAAWMNRGHALLSHPSRQTESVESLREAVSVLRVLPLDSRPFYRVNLAAAMMNAANALLRLGDLPQAVSLASEATLTTAPAEKTDCVLADVGLKARRVHADALRLRIATNEDNAEDVETTIGLATDVVEDGLALAKHWEAQHRSELRPAALRLFELGVHLYAVHMPNFLAEFILDQLDTQTTDGGLCEFEPFYTVSFAVLGQMRKDLESRRALFTATSETVRLVQRLKDVREAESRLHILRQTFVVPSAQRSESSPPS